VRTRLVFALAFVIACGGSSDATLEIEKVTPDHGPLGGGTRVVIEGAGFLINGAPPNRVVIGDNEAPLAAASSDGTLEVTIPSSDTPGPVPILVFNRNGSVVAEGKFRYSTPPTVTSVSPLNVPFDSITTTVTVTGTGFMDENAGVPIVDVAGGVPVDVKVVSDTQLTFTARPGVPLSRPTVKVTNARGTGSKVRAFRYIPGTSPGLIAFARGPSIFAIYFDPATMNVVTIPHVNATPNQHVRASFFDSVTGDTFAIMSGPVNQFQGGRANMQFGVLDFETQKILNPVAVVGAPNTIGKKDNVIYALNRDNARFGIFDPTTGITSQGAVVSGSRGGIAFDGTNAFWINSAGVSTFNVDTGVRGTVTALNPNVAIVESRFLGGVLYGVDRTGTVHTIVPATGVTAPIKSLPAPVSALEIFQP
jgi:hypothetical protein